MRRKGRAGIVVALVFGVSACSLIAGVSQATFRDDVPDSGAHDTGVVDAIATGDVGAVTDAMAAIDAGPAFCTSRIGTHFCADFEDPFALYGDQNVTGGGGNSRDTSIGFQSQTSLKFTSVETNYPETAGTQRVIPLGQIFLTKVAMEGVFRTNEVIPSAERVDLMQLGLSDGTIANKSLATIFIDGSHFFVHLHAARSKLDEDEDIPLSAVTVGSWTSLRIVADVSSRKLQVLVNGAMLLDRLYSFPGRLGDSASYGATTYRGLPGGIPARTIAWDNVLVDLL